MVDPVRVRTNRAADASRDDPTFANSLTHWLTHLLIHSDTRCTSHSLFNAPTNQSLFGDVPFNASRGGLGGVYLTGLVCETLSLASGLESEGNGRESKTFVHCPGNNSDCRHAILNSACVGWAPQAHIPRILTCMAFLLPEARQGNMTEWLSQLSRSKRTCTV